MCNINILIVLILMGSGLKAQPLLSYQVEFPQPWTQYAEISLDLQNLEQSFTDLEMAAWTPGHYNIRDYAGFLEGLEAKDQEGNKLQVSKLDKDTWRVLHPGQTSFAVSYRVHCMTHSVRTPFVNREHASLIPAGLYLYPAGVNVPASIRFIPYPEWKAISTALPVLNGDPYLRFAASLGELLDSPVELGNQLVLRFEAAGIPHELAIKGEGNYDTVLLKQDISAIAEVCTELFGHNPNSSFLFILHNTHQDYGGLEHMASTNMIYRRWQYQPKDRYLVFLGLVSHEYFHVWNGKRISPQPQSAMDYSKENYTDLLWMVEGGTQYYDDLLLLRAGLMREDEYLNIVAGNIDVALSRPGDAIQSVAESSFDTWIKYYQGNANSSNSTVSYYSKGALVVMAIDLEILANSGGKRRMDDVFRELYRRYRQNPDQGYTAEELKEILEQNAGRKLDDFFEKYIYGTEFLDLTPYFQRIGVGLENYGAFKPVLTFGASISSTGDVRRVVRDQPAWEAGLNPGDIILGVNGYRFQGDIKPFLESTEEGQAMDILLSRDEVLMNISVLPRKMVRNDFRVFRSATATPEEEALYRIWLSKP